jgi:hypothetical protein
MRQDMNMSSTHAEDLSRLADLKSQEMDLLVASGIRSLANLAKNEPSKLLAWMREVNHEARVLRKVPPLERVSAWVTGARQAINGLG